MDPRYENEFLKGVWSLLYKYQRWLEVELAIIQAKENLHMIPDGICKSISSKVLITEDTVKEIADIEAVSKHDLTAFVSAVQNQLPEEEKKYIHSGVTSYDTEEPAMALMLIHSTTYIAGLLRSLCFILISLAKTYRHTTMIAHTHSQHAQVYTLGIKLLGYAHDLINSMHRIELARQEIFYSKISGVIGTYGDGLTPDIEFEALMLLGLKRIDFSRQIVLRDRIANLITQIAIAGAVIEKMAIDFRLAASSERCELQEKFSRGQKGSSAMPHKKNPINAEKITGMSRLLRGYAMVALENIATWEERDISHSSAERIIFPDTFHTIAHMATVASQMFSGMVVNENKLQENIELTKGIAISPQIKDLCQEHGMKPDDAYFVLQELAFKTFDTNEDFIQLVFKDERIPKAVRNPALLQNLYDRYYKEVPPFIDVIFTRNESL